MQRKSKIVLLIIVGVIILFGVIWYYQKQGLIDILPTSQDLRERQALAINEDKFVPAEGLSPEDFTKKIQEAYDAREVVKANPENGDTWFKFGNTLQFLNDHEGAVEAWEIALEKQPLNFVVATNLGNTYQYFIKDWPKSEFYYFKAVEVRPDFTTAYDGLIDLYRYNYKEKFNELEPLVIQAINNDSPNAKGYYSILVEAFIDRGDLDKAKKYLIEVEKLSPDSAAELRASYPVLK